MCRVVGGQRVEGMSAERLCDDRATKVRARHGEARFPGGDVRLRSTCAAVVRGPTVLAAKPFGQAAHLGQGVAALTVKG